MREDLVLNSYGVGVLLVHVLRKGSTETLDILFVKLLSIIFPELCRTSGLLGEGFVSSCSSKRRDKTTLEAFLIQSSLGGFPFWRSIQEAYFVFSPGIRGKVFLFCLSFLDFDTWVVVLASVLFA